VESAYILHLTVAAPAHYSHSLHSPGAMALARERLLASLSALALMVAAWASLAVGGRPTDQLEILWGQTQVLNDGNGDQTIALMLDHAMGSAFKSKTSYLFARIDVDIKLIPRNSAGTVTTIYVNDLGEGLEDPRRDRPGVPGQHHRPALHPAHQHLRQRRGRQGGAVPALVRPHPGLPHLLHRLEHRRDPDPSGRRADPAVQEPLGRRRAVPGVPADASVRVPVGRRRLGDAGWARQDRLVAGAIRCLLQELHRLRVRPERRRLVGVRPGPLRLRRQPRLDGPGTGRRAAGRRREAAAAAEGGAGQVHDLQLLHRQKEVPQWLPEGVWAGL
uniref:GH16 domain-containing protein n=1 Tax=Aegilops tauschii subsp. strangulata TaxID=200361 RepID=A0A453CTU6_AEGTS